MKLSPTKSTMDLEWQLTVLDPVFLATFFHHLEEVQIHDHYDKKKTKRRSTETNLEKINMNNKLTQKRHENKRKLRTAKEDKILTCIPVAVIQQSELS